MIGIGCRWCYYEIYFSDVMVCYNFFDVQFIFIIYVFWSKDKLN